MVVPTVRRLLVLETRGPQHVVPVSVHRCCHFVGPPDVEVAHKKFPILFFCGFNYRPHGARANILEQTTLVSLLFFLYSRKALQR